MRKPFIIPRKDHEVYFFQTPAEVQGSRKKLKQYAAGHLAAVHPGFSGNTAFDIKPLVLDGAKWTMITAAKEDVLSEYRLLHPSKPLATATSVLVFQPDFTNSGIKQYNGEKIGYNRKTQEPVSDPFSLPEQASHTGTLNLKTGLPKLSSKAALFKKQIGKRRFLMFSLLGFLVLLSLIIFPRLSSPDEAAAGGPAPEAEPPPRYLPSPASILADVSEKVLSAQGILSQFIFNENTPSTLTLHIQNSEPSRMSGALNEIGYLSVSGISDIRYKNKIPGYTLYLSADYNRFTTPPARHTGGIREILASLEKARTQIIQTKGRIINEILPPPAARTGIISLVFSIDAGDAVDLVRHLENLFLRESLRMRTLDVSADLSGKLFHISLSFERADNKTGPDTPLSENILLFPQAFGFFPRTLPAQTTIQPRPQTESRQVPAAGNKIGSIITEENRRLIYYRNGEGKIIAIEE